MTKIVFAHCGTGKSYCAKMQPDKCLDLPCMPYKYFLKERLDGREAEAMKGACQIEEMNPQYPRNYSEALVEYWESGEYEYIFAPPDQCVALFLEEEKIPYTLVYPEFSLKEEYEQRYIKRGNGEEFLSVFVDGWEFFMCQMDDMAPPTRIRLGSGQYLSDVL